MHDALDARIVRIHRRGHEIGEAGVGDEAAALLHLQHRFPAFRPFGNAHLAAQHAGFDAHVGDRLGEAECAAPRFVLPSPGRAAAHVELALLRRAALVDGRKRQASGQAAGGRAGVHPGQLKRHQRQRQVLRPFDEAAVRGIHEHAGDARFVERFQQAGLFRRPFVGVARARRHQPGHRSARHRPHRLHQHLQIVAIREAPENLPDIVSRQGAQILGLRFRSGCGHPIPTSNRLASQDVVKNQAVVEFLSSYWGPKIAPSCAVGVSEVGQAVPPATPRRSAPPPIPANPAAP